MNPVRAGMVEDPKDYRWSGYGAAMAGQRRAKEGLRKVVEGLQQGVDEPERGVGGVSDAFVQRGD